MAKYAAAFDSVLNAMLSDGAFGSLPHISEVNSDLTCSVMLASNMYYKQALQALRGVLELSVAQVHFVTHPEDFQGWVSATTAFGKTVVAAWLIARRGVNTPVLVHRRQLLDQWVERLAAFLDLPTKSIGRVGGGRHTPTGLLDVAVIQSLVRKGVVDDRVAATGS